MQGSGEIRVERMLAHPPEKVWHALTRPDHLSQWYPLTVTALDLRLGGRVSFDDGEGTTYEGVVTELDRPWRFAFTEGDELLRLELRPHDDGCLLTLTHRFDASQAWPGASEGWRQCLDALAVLVVADPDDTPLGTVADQHDGRQELRFERRLTHPPEKVWRALTRRDQLRNWFAAHTDRDFAPDARVRFTMTPEAKRQMNVADGAESLGEGTVTVFDPPRRLEYTWDGQVMIWELVPSGDGCVLVFTTVFDHEGGASEAAGWHAALEVLAARLGEREVGWSPWDRVGPLTAVYGRAVRTPGDRPSDPVEGAEYGLDAAAGNPTALG